MNTKIRSCMNALLAGHTISLKGQNYRLFKPGEEIKTPSTTGSSDYYWLGYEMTSSTKGKVYVGCDIEFVAILDLFESLTEEESFIMGTNAVLNKINEKDRSNVEREKG